MVLSNVEDLFINKFNSNNETTSLVIKQFRPSFIDQEKAKSDSIELTRLKYEKFSDIEIRSTENEELFPAKSKQINFLFLN